jgi:hypothetical protein
MDIGHLIWDIKKLRSHACQEFLEMILIDKWQTSFYAIIDSYKKTGMSYSHKYDTAYITMRSMGIPQYSTKNMDVTLIKNIVSHIDSLYKPIKKETKDSFIRITDDRNLTCHLNDNEGQEELCIQAQLYLRDFEDFVKSVDAEIGTIEDAKRQRYLQTYLPEISKFKIQVEKCRFEITRPKLEREKDIQYILESKDKIKTWQMIHDKYLQEYRVSGNDEKYMAFLTEAADANLINAAYLLGMHYFDVSNYDEAEHYLSCLYANRKDRVDPIAMMRLAEIYLNNLSSKPGDGLAILKTLIDKGFNIIKSDNGMHYTLKFKNSNDYTISINIRPNK